MEAAFEFEPLSIVVSPREYYDDYVGDLWHSPSRKYSYVLPVKSSPSETSSSKDGIEVKKDDNEDDNDEKEKENKNEEVEVDEIKPSDKQASGYNGAGHQKEICTR